MLKKQLKDTGLADCKTGTQASHSEK